MYKIFDHNWLEEEEAGEYWEEQGAIVYTLAMLPHDEFPYFILDDPNDDHTAIVFQNQVWRPDKLSSQAGGD